MPSVRNPDGTWVHTFSSSWMSTYAKCPEQARRRYFRLDPEGSSELTALGKAVHLAIEHMINQKADRRMLPAYQTFAKEEFVKATQVPGFQWVKYDQAACYTYISQHLTTFVDEILPGLQPVATEVPFDVEAYADVFRTVRFRGFIDYVDELTGITDWKTAGAPHKVWEKEKQDVQSVVYPWAWSILTKENDLHWRKLRYVVFLHGKGKQEYAIQRTVQHFEWLKHQALQAALLIEANLPHWTMNDSGWWCAEKWCSSWTNCKGKFLP